MSQLADDGKVKAIRNGLLQQKIDAAAPYDTLYIEPGVYNEFNITIQKPLTLIGKNYPEVNAREYGEVFVVQSDSVSISGFKIAGAGVSDLHENAGVKIDHSDYVHITNNILENNFFGIYLAKSNNCTIHNNTLNGNSKSETSSGNGVHLWKCDSIHIYGNTVRGHRDAIYIEFSSYSTIAENVCSENIRYGLHFMTSNHNFYTGNIFRNNTAGVAVMYSKFVHMTGNTFANNHGSSSFGLLLKDITDSEISRNVFNENSVAVRIEGSSRVDAQQNSFTNNGWALMITANCMEVHFTRNNFMLNSFDVSTNGSLMLNNFNGNYWDKYEGYDLNRDAIGDVPFHPVSLFATIIEKVPEAIMLYRSFAQYLVDKAEKVIPSITPENLLDEKPLMQPANV
ncbi:MAG: nitrous oxide reductase family maturation protein NosD, partial [Chitinophagales bacterium]